jgi:hypothetical protein
MFRRISSLGMAKKGKVPLHFFPYQYPSYTDPPGKTTSSLPNWILAIAFSAK